MTNNIKDYYQIDDEERPHHVLGTALDEIFAMLPTSSTPSASATMKMHADDIDDDMLISVLRHVSQGSQRRTPIHG